MRFTFDPAKSKRLRKNPHRRIGFEEAQELFAAPHYTNLVSEYPEQFRAIGWVGERLMSIIFEPREDADGEYLHLVTLWTATREERTLYEENNG